MRREPVIFHSLMHSVDLLEHRLTTLLTSTGIKPRQARVLNALARMGEVSQKALVESFDVTSGSMSTMIDRMETAGLLRRRRNPRDRRADLISITAHGEAVLEDVRDVWREIDDLVESKLGARKAVRLAELTRELKFALGGKVAAGAEAVEAARRATAEDSRREGRQHER